MKARATAGKERGRPRGHRRPGLRRSLWAKHADLAEGFFVGRWQLDWGERLTELVDAAVGFDRLHADWLVREILQQPLDDSPFPPEEVGRSPDYDYLRAFLRRPHPRARVRTVSLRAAVLMAEPYHAEEQRTARRARARERLRRMRRRQVVLACWALHISRRHRRRSPVLKTFADGHTLCLLRPVDLPAEARAMQNCIDSMDAPYLLHFSLRSAGETIAHFTLGDGLLMDAKGQGNDYAIEAARPVARALDYLASRFLFSLPDARGDFDSARDDYEIWMELAWDIRDAGTVFTERRARLIGEIRTAQMELPF